jgi:hypothetical protein
MKQQGAARRRRDADKACPLLISGLERMQYAGMDITARARGLHKDKDTDKANHNTHNNEDNRV